MKHIKLVVASFLFISCAILGYRVISKSITNQEVKVDYAEINHIKYGLFSVNEWKEQLSGIISDEINDFNLTKSNEKEIKKLIEGQLNVLIDKVDTKLKETNKKTAKGRLKQKLIEAFVDINDIKSGIPEYSDAIMKEMSKAQSERKIKGMVKKKVDQFIDKTFENQDVSAVTQIILRKGLTDIESTKIVIDKEIADNKIVINQESWSLMGIAALLFLILGFGRRPLPASHFGILILTLLVLLAVGVTTPMIDLEAKISEFSFVLMDHPVKFVNQVLYFQTKSILDVFWIMITHVDLQMKVVGILMVAFSIVFPLIKMISSFVYYYDFRKARENIIIKFFVLKSGKWSMTDVLVVAIFMAYIGFNGIISSQFGKFDTADAEMTMLTTNGTSLQPGFYVFLTYTILALFLSGFLTRKDKVENNIPL